jgi:hypothetical protein
MELERLKKEIMETQCNGCKRNCLKKINQIENQPYKSNPGKLRASIRDVKEKAMQRALLGLADTGKIDSEAKTILKGEPKEIYWLDMEVPVAESPSRRRPCIDLLGRSNAGETVICELKYVTPGETTHKSDCPIYAVLEILNYHEALCKNRNKLRHSFKSPHQQEPKTDIWNDYGKNTLLLVAGNASYWEYWQDNFNISSETFKTISKLAGITIWPYKFEDIVFKTDDNGKHCPGKCHEEISEWKLI